MSGEPTELEKFVKEVLKKLMGDRSLSEGVQALSTRGLEACPSTWHHFGRVNLGTEQQSKHPSDLANAKKIPSILPEYNPPLVGTARCNNIPRNYEYTQFTVYILKGIHVVESQLGQIPPLCEKTPRLESLDNTWLTCVQSRHIVEELRVLSFSIAVWYTLVYSQCHYRRKNP